MAKTSLTPRPMKGTRLRLKVRKTTDGQAAKEFNDWVVRTGRARFIDWNSVKVDNTDPEATFVDATTE